MAGDRLSRILARLSAKDVPGGETRRLCEVSAEVMALSGAGIMLVSGELPHGSLCTTDTVSS